MAAQDVNTAVDAAVAAIGDEDWGTALNKLLQAKAYLIAIPDRTADRLSLQYDRGAVDALIADVRREQSAAGSAASGGVFGQQKIVYVPTTD